jgi:ADP-ribosylglycohydrolase
VLGAFVADSAGSYVEFRNHHAISEKDVEDAMTLPGGGPFRLLPGQVTDDSEMAMCILHGLVPEDPTTQEEVSFKKFGPITDQATKEELFFDI